MPLNTLRSHARSLRTRLMLWNAGAVAVTGILILLAVRAGVEKRLISDLDDVLGEDLQEIKLHFVGDHAYNWSAITEELDRKAEGHFFHRWFVKFYQEDDQPGWSSQSAPDIPAPSPEQKQRKSFSVDPYRVLYGRLDSPLKEGAYVCVGCSQLYVSRDMQTIDRQVIGAGFIVLLISPLVGHFLTGRVIRPLAQMIRTTAKLHPGEVAERVPLRGTGDELDSLAATINGLLDRISTYLQQEHDFLANAAHDLRTPLAAIRSNVEVALGVERSEEEYREILGLVIEQCSYLQTLVNQLLLLAETDADRLQPDNEPVRLDQIVDRVVAMFEGVADDHHVELRYDDLDAVLVPGNRQHLRQVVSNLIDNAIKFTAARRNAEPCQPDDKSHQGCILVKLQRDEAAGRALLRVKDNGIGIAPDDKAKVFDRFFRVDKARARDGGSGGTGLGLSICKAIVECHGGQITVESQPGEGATFTISLPLYRAPEGATVADRDERMLGLP
jgi:signal transduction histidine kinase